jgi:hypothetical protein
MSEIEAAYRQLYDSHYPPMRFLSDLGSPVPKAFHAAAELILNIDLHRAVSGDALDTENILNLVDTTRSWKVDIDNEGIGYEFKENLVRMMAALVETPGDIDILHNLGEAVSLAIQMPFTVDLWKVQNLYWSILQTGYSEFKQKAERNDRQAVEWVKDFNSLGKLLKIRVG